MPMGAGLMRDTDRITDVLRSVFDTYSDRHGTEYITTSRDVPGGDAMEVSELAEMIATATRSPHRGLEAAAAAAAREVSDRYHLGGSETAMLLGDAFEKFAEALEAKANGNE